jgi:hypothetical protein
MSFQDSVFALNRDDWSRAVSAAAMMRTGYAH